MAPTKIPEVLTPEDQAALLGQPNRRCPSGERNHALLRLALDGGLRSAELVALRWSSIDLETGRVKIVQGKGRKDRNIWIGALTIAALEAWRTRQRADTPWVFSTMTGWQLDPRYLRQMVKRYAIRAGLGSWVHPHTLRHTFATDLYRQTKDLRLVQRALGHSSISTTQVYTHIVDSELEEAMKGLRER